MPKSNNNRVILEEEVKNKVAETYFKKFDCTKIIGDIDFCACIKNNDQTPSLIEQELIIQSLLWAEAKKGNQENIYESFVQLILTIGKSRFFAEYLPPLFLGAFDSEKIAFIPYHEVMPVFRQNDFNWNVRPSDHKTKEFNQLYRLCENTLKNQTCHFNYSDDDGELKKFIRENFKPNSKDLARISIDKNNFTFVYQKWCKRVKPSINVNWEQARIAGILDADFYLADLLSEKNNTLLDNLFVVLRANHYELDRRIDAAGLLEVRSAQFTDGQKAHQEFWNLYKRPPEEEYQNYIIGRRDLLVPSDIREIKGSFFTPQIWVKKSQEYLADVLGENWQDEYYIWDCCAGTGNMEMGLSNKRNIWVSTIDQPDVEVMKITQGLDLFENHIFQFDFLNDEFSKCPEELQEILNDEEKRKKLLIYINPPYKEAGNEGQLMGVGTNAIGVATETKVYQNYSKEMGGAARELFVQFLYRIYKEIPGCIIGTFSKLKNLQSSNFKKLRNNFKANLEKSFIVPANTFDNVKGKFPIGFFIWDLSKSVRFYKTITNVYDSNGQFLMEKKIDSYDQNKLIIEWLRKYYDKNGEKVAYLCMAGTDLQHCKNIFLASSLSENDINEKLYTYVTFQNIFPACIYIAVRNCIKVSWFNDRDQFLSPNDSWESDEEFKTDCFAFILFNGQNKVSLTSRGEKYLENHWIPFTEDQVGSKKEFQSHFMSDFIAGKIEILDKNDTPELPNLGEKKEKKKLGKITFSSEAQAVYNSGLELWKYYFSKNPKNHNASFYDIREYFQDRDNNGRMNNDSPDAGYNQRISDLREKMKVLARKIEEKVYEYGFLIK